MGRLRRVDCSIPGIRRVKRGRTWTFVEDSTGEPIDEPDVLERINELVIPPAWKDVWICPFPNGHIQATGIDQAGRKQYVYHQRWRERRDREKFDGMVEFARALPALRADVEEILHASEELSRERVLACAVRLLERGFFRIGSEDYAARNETFGLATMRKEHVRLEEGFQMVFDYSAKHGKRRLAGIVDPLVYDIVGQLKRRRLGGDELLAYRDGKQWRDIKSVDINAFLKERTGGDYSAKDFRTWNGTVLCALGLAASAEVAATPTGRKRAIARAVKEVSHYLGNTPAVCRASYIDPRVIDAYTAKMTIRPALEAVVEHMEPGEMPSQHPLIEEAVLDLLEGRSVTRSPGLAKAA